MKVGESAFGTSVPAARRPRRALLAALAPLLLAFGPPQSPVDERLEEAWRWRTIDGPDGPATVFHFVRPGADGELLALDDKGLLAYDGWEWRREPGWTDLVDPDVRDIAPLADGLVVLADGLVKTVDSHGTWAKVGGYDSPAWVSQLCRSDDGSVDMAYNGGIVRVAMQGLQPLMPSPEAAGKSLSLARDASGALWCAGVRGVYRQVDEEWERMSTGVMQRDVPVWYRQAVRSGDSVVFLPERLDSTTRGLLWNGSELAVLRPDNESFKIADASPAPDGSIIVATRGPNLRVLRDGRWHKVQLPLTTQENVVSLALTEGQQLAAVFASGRLAICDLGSNEWESFDTGAAGAGKSVNVITPRAAGGMWIGTDGGCLSFDGKSFGKAMTEALDLPLSEVTAVCEDGEGGLWLGSGSGFKGAFRLKDGRWTRYAGADDLGEFFVHAIRLCGDEVWFALIGDPLGVFKAGGLVRWKHGEFTRFVEEPDGSSMPRSYDVLQRQDGSLVAGLSASVRTFEETRWQGDPTTPIGTRSAFALHETADGALWVGFGLSIPGVARLADGKWRMLDSGSWQRAAAACFAETRDGRLWISSEKGLFLAHEEECREVSARLPMRTFWPVYADGENGLWLGTLGEGLLHFTPEDRQPPVIHDLDLHVGEAGDMVARWVARDRWNATPPEELSFRVLLDGQPAQSNVWVSGQQAVFPPLSSGPHELRVTAVDSLGNASARPMVHAFTVPPPWWRSLPVLLAAGATAAVLLWLLIVIRNRRRERAVAAAAQRELNERLSSLTLRLLSTQEDERRNISREMHDDLGQLLTAACLDIERATRLSDPDRRREALHSALRAARDTQQRVREISHMLRPTELDDHGLPQAVATIITDFISRSGIDVESNISVEARLLPTDVANHVFRILQEALTNILRHARAATAFVTLQATPGGIELKVSDDGVGFDEDTIPPTRRFGLLGMRERAELLGGKFSIRSKPEGGTEVSVSIPIPHR